MAGFFDQLDGAATGWLKTWMMARDRRIDNDRSLTASRKAMLKKYYRSNPHLALLHRASIENPAAFADNGQYKEFKNFQQYDPEYNARLKNKLMTVPDEMVEDWIQQHKPVENRFETIMNIKQNYPDDPEAVQKVLGAYANDSPENMDHFMKNYSLIEPDIKNRMALLDTINDSQRFILYSDVPDRNGQIVPDEGSWAMYQATKNLEDILRNGNPNEINRAIHTDHLVDELKASHTSTQHAIAGDLKRILGPTNPKAQDALRSVLLDVYNDITPYERQTEDDADGYADANMHNPEFLKAAIKNSGSLMNARRLLKDYALFASSQDPKDNEWASEILKNYIRSYGVEPLLRPGIRPKTETPEAKTPVQKAWAIEVNQAADEAEREAKGEPSPQEQAQVVPPMTQQAQPQQPQQPQQSQEQSVEDEISQIFDELRNVGSDISRSGKFVNKATGLGYEKDEDSIIEKNAETIARLRGTPKEAMDANKVQIENRIRQTMNQFYTEPLSSDEYFRLNKGGKAKLFNIIKTDIKQGLTPEDIAKKYQIDDVDYIKKSVSEFQQPTSVAPQQPEQPAPPPGALGGPQNDVVQKLKAAGAVYDNTGVWRDQQGQPVTLEQAHQLLKAQPGTPEAAAIDSFYGLQQEGRWPDDVSRVINEEYSAENPEPPVLPTVPHQPAVAPIAPEAQNPNIRVFGIPESKAGTSKPLPVKSVNKDQTTTSKPPGE